MQKKSCNERSVYEFCDSYELLLNENIKTKWIEIILNNLNKT